MKTRIIFATAALGCFSLAQAQEGTAAPATDAALPVEQTTTVEKSAYHDCLLSAGKETFAVLGLDEGQVMRMSELQARYKADLKAADEAKVAEEKAAKKNKGKAVAAKPVLNAVVVKEPDVHVATLPPAENTTPVDKAGVVEEQAADPLRTDVADPTVLSTDEAAQVALPVPETTLQTPGIAIPSDPATGDGLQGILTAYQFNMWHKQCYRDLEETGMIQP